MLLDQFITKYTVCKSEYFTYQEEFSCLWGQRQEHMRNTYNGVRKRKRLTVAKTDPELDRISKLWQFGLAGVQNFYKIK